MKFFHSPTNFYKTIHFQQVTAPSENPSLLVCFMSMPCSLPPRLCWLILFEKHLHNHKPILTLVLLLCLDQDRLGSSFFILHVTHYSKGESHILCHLRSSAPNYLDAFLRSICLLKIFCPSPLTKKKEKLKLDVSSTSHLYYFNQKNIILFVLGGTIYLISGKL